MLGFPAFVRRGGGEGRRGRALLVEDFASSVVMLHFLVSTPPILPLQSGGKELD